MPSRTHLAQLLRTAWQWACLAVLVLSLPHLHAEEAAKEQDLTPTEGPKKTDPPAPNGPGEDGWLIENPQKTCRIRLTPYGERMVRVQIAAEGEPFLPDDRYSMMAQHDWSAEAAPSPWTREQNTFKGEVGRVVLHQPKAGTPPKPPNGQRGQREFALSFHHAGASEPMLKLETISLDSTWARVHFAHQADEHFCGLGHGFYGRVDALDLRGQAIERNYPDQEKGQQAPLIVPFYLSSKGYGVFLNSTYPNHFTFGQDGEYGFGLKGRGEKDQPGAQLDFFLIWGPDFPTILDTYTKLTGRPRLPRQEFFGLHLSDKGEPDHPGAEWWREKVNKHRSAGFPLDHLAMDNRWRAGSGAWSGSWFEWSKERFPDPAGFGEWCKNEGLMVTLDLNMNICNDSWGWQEEFNMPGAEKMEDPHSVPDYTNPATRSWVWNLFWKKSLNPELNYPGDALWMDEVDELGAISENVRVANGRTWQEEKNNYFLRIAQAVVQEGWDRAIGAARRPFVWVRGGTSGSQRWTTHWTGDIDPTYQEMRQQLRGMLASGLSGFPYFNHDAGGFHHGPSDELYIQWSMAWGSWTPIWRPHGPGTSRWPLDRSAACQEAARRAAHLRYELMPYHYTQAWRASQTGLPMARPLVLEHPSDPKSWATDLQYYWGPDFLVAPVCRPMEELTRNEAGDPVLPVYFPPEGRRSDSQPGWINYWTGQAIDEPGQHSIPVRLGYLPLFLRANAILPRRTYAPCVQQLDREHLILELDPSTDGQTELYEDDGRSEHYRTKQEFALTPIRLQDKKLTIGPTRGQYEGQPETRSYQLRLRTPKDLAVTYQSRKLATRREAERSLPEGVLTCELPAAMIDQPLTVEFHPVD